MGTLEIFLIAIGLSFDTFAVSVTTGVKDRYITFYNGLKIAIVLATFQGLMPYIGYIGGIQIERYISQFDHWIALVLLLGLGIKMIYESLISNDETSDYKCPLNRTILLSMAIATSIDALVVGISFAFFNINILFTILMIGGVTFLSSMLGMLLGKKVTGRFGDRIEILGGLILVGIGIKIFIQHTV